MKILKAITIFVLCSCCVKLPAQNQLTIDFGQYLTAPFNPSACTFTISDVPIQFFNWYSGELLCYEPVPDEFFPGFQAKIQRSDLPLSGETVMVSVLELACPGVIDFFEYSLHYADGENIVGFGESITIENFNELEYLTVAEVECGLAGFVGIGSVRIQFEGNAGPAGVTISPITCLQAAYDANTGLMRDDLRTANILPLTEPYTALGYPHTGGGGGETTTQDVFNVSGPDAIVDWVVVELRDKSDFSSVLATRSALLQRDGDVVDTDGVSPVSFSDLEADDYYVAIQHRNHLGVMTASPVAVSSTAATVDFTSDLNNIFGGSNGVAEVGEGMFCMFSGDFDGNGQIQNTDFAAMVLTLGTAGYSFGDFDMNGQIQNTDLQFFLIPNIGRGQAF